MATTWSSTQPRAELAPVYGELDPAQVIEHNAPVPGELMRGPKWNLSPEDERMMTLMMGRDLLRLMCYNKTQEDRICPTCRTRYRPVAADQAFGRALKEQRLSGICSGKCWVTLNGPDSYIPSEWQGCEADAVYVSPVGITLVRNELPEN